MRIATSIALTGGLATLALALVLAGGPGTALAASASSSSYELVGATMNAASGEQEDSSGGGVDSAHLTAGQPQPVGTMTGGGIRLELGAEPSTVFAPEPSGGPLVAAALGGLAALAAAGRRGRSDTTRR